MSFPVAGTQHFGAAVAWRPDANFNEDVVFEIGLRWQRKDGAWINPVSFEHTARKVRGYVGHGEAGLLVLTNENTEEEHVRQLFQASCTYGLGQGLEFWNVDHPQGLSFQQVALAFRNRMMFEVTGANRANQSSPLCVAVIQAVVQLRLKYWVAADTPRLHPLSIAGPLLPVSAGVAMLDGKKGLRKALKDKTAPLRLGLYTKIAVEVHQRVRGQPPAAAFFFRLS